MPRDSHAGDIGHDGDMSTFDERAAGWDTPERIERAHEVAEAIRAHVALDKQTRAIDIGSGTGLLGLALLADVSSVVLADPSEGMVEAARAKIEAQRIEHASAVTYDVTDAPPRGAPFDLALSLLVMHHVEDNAAVLRSVHALLVPGGQMALVDLDAEDGSFHDDPDAEGIHHHGFDQASLVARAQAVGFTAVATRNITEITRDNGRRYPLFLLTGRRA